MLQHHYMKQVELLLQVLPEIFKRKCFALKGGTAINFFVRDMPRLSIDIDLVYLPKEPREIFLQNLTQALQELMKEIQQKITGCKVQKSPLPHTEYFSKFVVSQDNVAIKVETNIVLRQSLFDCEVRTLCQSIQDKLMHYVKANTLSFAELYAGKICAALDRQHPRDLFDIKLLLENEGITAPIQKAFVVYLASSPRPMDELLNGHPLDHTVTFESEFMGMTNVDVTYPELFDTREKLSLLIKQSLTENERQFLLSLMQGEPQWELLDIPGVQDFPSLQWKLLNIRKMDKLKWDRSIDSLKKILDL